MQQPEHPLLLILINFDSVFDHFLIRNYSCLNRYNSGAGRDIILW